MCKNQEEMIVKLKKVLGLGMAAVMVMSMAVGCSSSGDSSNKDESGKDGDETVITIWSKDRHDAKYVQSKIDEYNENNTDNIRVEYELYTDNYEQAVDMAVQNGELPDILVYQNKVFDKYVNEGQWADLYQYMDDEMKTYFQDVIIKGYNEFDGKLYYIPTAGSTPRLFYNKEIFDRVGIENPPTTLEEMVEDAKLITSELSGEGIYGFAQNMKSVASALDRSMKIGLQAETGKVEGYDFKEGKYDFTDWADELKLWKELLSEECAFPGCESLDIDPLRTQFAAGKIGMYCSYSQSEPGVYANQFPMDSAKWDAVPIPTVGGERAGKQYYEGTCAYLLNAEGENVEKAFQVYKDIFASEDYLVGYYEGGYGVSIIPSVIEKAQPSEDFQTKEWLLINPETDAILPKTPQQAYLSGFIVEGKDVNQTCESILYGDEDIETSLQDLTNRYNDAYQKAIDNGTGWEIKIDNYDPMNPTLE